jgi:hypothetical protein
MQIFNHTAQYAGITLTVSNGFRTCQARLEVVEGLTVSVEL